MIEYKILEEETVSELQDDVREMIKRGWEPQGGVSVAISPGRRKIFIQAIVKKDGVKTHEDIERKKENNYSM